MSVYIKKIFVKIEHVNINRQEEAWNELKTAKFWQNDINLDSQHSFIYIFIIENIVDWFMDAPRANDLL